MTSGLAPVVSDTVHELKRNHPVDVVALERAPVQADRTGIQLVLSLDFRMRGSTPITGFRAVPRT